MGSGGGGSGTGTPAGMLALGFKLMFGLTSRSPNSLTELLADADADADAEGDLDVDAELEPNM